ncbi:hypothetical protein AQUSIP_22530 [Aquicella siphonis]|uniref:Uncharacterized protein n=1 Tax=Aquicella siphonis TaxID=254247 RepID=A0A5E4PL31_9COXI|nr:hypothetical protein [Aquicella siphonis]VVC76926.1 hypothetical protein AQUSIP_22530 [Aquicella siphonis]
MNPVKIYKQCWIGEASLAQAFWLIYVLFTVIFIIIADFLVDILVAGSFTPFYVHNQYSDLIITITFPFLFVNAMCVWISGKNSSWKWSLISKVTVILPLIFGTFHITRLF